MGELDARRELDEINAQWHREQYTIRHRIQKFDKFNLEKIHIVQGPPRDERAAPRESREYDSCGNYQHQGEEHPHLRRHH